MTDLDPSGSERPSRPSGWSADGAQQALMIAGAVTLVTTAAIALAFQPGRAGQPGMLEILLATYLVLAGVGIHRLRARGELRQIMRPASGDLTVGAAAAALLYGIATAAAMAIARHGSPREVWIATIYEELGDPTQASYHLTSALIFVIAALEEMTWRGLVMRVLERPFGARKAWLGSTLLYGLAHLPTAFLLRNSVVGPNPLLVGAAIGCGFVWGYLANRSSRMMPAIFAHALFTWAVVEFPLWRP